MRLARVPLDGFDEDLAAKDFPGNHVLIKAIEEDRRVVAGRNRIVELVVASF